jgi:hypothetical protein
VAFFQLPHYFVTSCLGFNFFLDSGELKIMINGKKAEREKKLRAKEKKNEMKVALYLCLFWYVNANAFFLQVERREGGSRQNNL